MSVRLVSIEAEAFRGFGDRVMVPLDADAVIVTGSNGVGKTTLVDAICWALTGRIGRLQDRRYHKNEDVVVSRYRPGEQAFVRLQLRGPDGMISLTRQGTSISNILTVVDSDGRHDGDAAEDHLAAWLRVRGRSGVFDLVDRSILEQEALRAILDSGPEELHLKLREMLGLGVLERFETEVAELHRRRLEDVNGRKSRWVAAEQDARTAAEGVARLTDEMAQLGVVDSALQDARRVCVEEQTYVALSLPVSVESSRTALAALRAAYERLRDARAEILRLESELAAQPTVDEAKYESMALRLAAEEAAEAGLVKELEAQEARLLAARRHAGALVSLAAAALPLLSDTCPVCRQAIDKNEVAARLSEASDLSPSLEGIQVQVAEIRAKLDDKRVSLRGLRSGMAAAKAATAGRSRIIADLDGQWSIANSVSDQVVVVNSPEAKSAIALEPALNSLVRLGQAVSAVVSTSQRATIGSNLESTRVRADHLAAETKRLESEFQGASKRETIVREFLAAVRRASVSVVGDSMEAINPLFSEVYRRLSPHPTFTDLELEHDFYRTRGRSLPVVVDPTASVRANPNVVCSVGQLNVVALSYFLALSAFSDNSGMMVVLDDPLQSLDEVNALGFADFCRQLRRNRQVIVTTHDRRFGSLLARKLAPRTDAESALEISFDGWDRSGPTIKHAWREPELVKLLMA